MNAQNIPRRQLTNEQHDPSFETMLSEITLRNKNWVIIGVYKPPIQKDEPFLQNLI